MPYNEQALPIRANERRENPLPKAAKSRALVLEDKRLAARDAGRNRDVKRESVHLDVEDVALADAVGHGELGADVVLGAAPANRYATTEP